MKEIVSRTYFHAAMDALHVAGFVCLSQNLPPLQSTDLGLRDRYTEHPSLDAIRTLLILHHYYTQQHSNTASFMLNAATQIAISLGLVRLFRAIRLVKS